ncbi:nucleolar MIF4G domain-containing protein 1 [Tribolium castaneum]|uniref:Nucleolar MIF4G domain-containing protein 1 homolog-like Protein n=1 Tax=Tribolium castaneum TaxID=7070 RepID=D6WD15_TRICA|nr:PREDICTED: nucleolar MIF4G domain-containing protein 1 [Tribolium castaneum]EEZ99092.1 Nucleolar MIF4G domain-containing protein 1 homolog-like Protein [Tribolium castaneum]|eukprot:XP_971260.2 PREDICTED: nucleolar MIF4G domain-containing protein 1 [Tribolium castaneum]
MSAKKVKRSSNKPKTRKEIRKEQRKSKKSRRHEYYTNRKKPGQFVRINPQMAAEIYGEEATKPAKESNQGKQKNQVKTKMEAENVRDKEKKQQSKLQKDMSKQRNKQLVEANLEEDRTIRRLEKQLKLNKRKSKSVPASFSRDGLDYLLEVCDPENLKNTALAEQQLAEVNDEFEEDLVLMTEDKPSKIRKQTDDYLNSSEDEIEEEENFSESETEEIPDMKKRKIDEINDDKSEDSESFEEEENSDEESPEKTNDDGTWEDIYGRLRAKDGSVVTSQKYVPPGARTLLENGPEDKMRSQKLERLKRQLKGLINRLAESNMHSIATQIEELYMSNSRNDMNNTITNLVTEALVSNILAPERLLMEHILLITILHANVGTEVGAHFLQTIVKMFDDYLKKSNVEDKKLDNVVVILAQLYNFKLFDCKLIYEILDTLAENFEEKHVECILHVLRNVGFNLRKDNPIALKNLILSLQKRASNASNELKDNSRVKFMLDILLAIKNNNVSKIPNYDTTYSEHLKKIMKGFIRKGNYVTQLNISLEDLLKAEEKGKWWVVGSAWVGNTDKTPENVKETPNSFSQKLLELATKQRMNTDARKNIFCVIMSAEDYLDAFEKLLRLSLKNQQEREIIHVILHCCLQEKAYNPYYATLAQKFCEYDRRFQMTIKYSIWDKLKALKDHSATQISHLAKLLSHLFIEKGLPISTLKVVQFSELDKVTLRFVRQILLGILLHEDLDVCKGVFEKVGFSDKLKMFRESLRLFLHHFLLKNLESHNVEEEKKELLQQRVKIVEKLLVGREIRL